MAPWSLESIFGIESFSVMSEIGITAKMQYPGWELLLPRQLTGWVPSRPWLSVKPGKAAAVRTRGRRLQTLAAIRIPPSLADDQLAEWVHHLSRSRGPYLVFSPFLRRSLRELLERRGIGYLDSRGHLHLVAPGVLVHMGELAAAPPGRLSGEAALGAHGVRAVQALLDDPGPVSVTALAGRVRLSVAQTHDVLVALERASVVRSSGRGPAKRRTVIDRAQLLDWLAHQPAARRREIGIDAALYARRPEDLWTAVTSSLDRARIRHALTGAAAASLFGVGPTSVTLSRIRVDPAVPLEDAISVIRAQRTDRAPNIRLIRDTGDVGVIGSEIRQGARVSPKVRIYLDCLAERRGEDIAEQYRDAVLRY